MGGLGVGEPRNERASGSEARGYVLAQVSMDSSSFKEWLAEVGLPRVWLLVAVVIARGGLLVINPPWYISSKPLLLPCSALVFLDILSAVLSAIIVVECLSVLAHRWASSWNTKQRLTAVSIFFALGIVAQTVCAHQISNRYYQYASSVADNKNYSEAK